MEKYPIGTKREKENISLATMDEKNPIDYYNPNYNSKI